MIFLKSLLFIGWNVILGVLIVVKFRWLLFNSKPRYIFGKRIPLTPGFLVAKREWLFNKARSILHDYLDQAADPIGKTGYLKAWLEKITEFLWDKTSFVSEWRFLPLKLKERIRHKIVDAFAGIAENILRKTVPRLIEQFRVEYRIEEFDEQFSIDFFYGYFRRYVYKPLLIAFAAVNLLIGISNMILYLIIA